MYYKYETHMHTAESSGCSNSSAVDMVRKYKDEGYTGVFITDHFLNGNTAVPRDLPWKEWVETYCRSYEIAKEEGDKIGLDVFFGFEFGDGSADLLTYGPDKQWLIEHPEIMTVPTWQYMELVHSVGGMIVHAHPFRQEEYIKGMLLSPRFEDAVEVINASNRLPEFNERAQIYADWYDLPVTAGSDSHNTTNRYYGGGIVTDFKLESVGDYIRVVKERKIVKLLDKFGKKPDEE